MYCGDGILQPREQCERTDTSGNIVNPNCSATCQFTSLPSCGDAVIQVGEECDDGNTQDFDGCTSLCKFEEQFCPDGKATCSDGKCSTGVDCAEAICGDGVVQSALGEQCDDGNDIDDDDCTNSCTWTIIAECGDGVLQPETEQCDDGAGNSMSPNAECRTNCLLQYCGDGIFDSFIEECDDHNNVNGDGCTAVCTVENRAAPPPTVIGSVIPPTYYPPTIPTPAKTPTGPGLVIFLASGAAAGVGLVRRRYLDRK